MERDDKDKVILQQSKITFNWINKSYTMYISYIFKQNEVPMDEPIYVGFATIELGKLIKYEF